MKKGTKLGTKLAKWRKTLTSLGWKVSMRHDSHEMMGWDEDFHFEVLWLNDHIWEALAKDKNTPWWCNEVAVATIRWKWDQWFHNLDEVRYQHSKMCEALTMLSNRISRLQGGSQLGQLAPFINHTNGSRRLCSTLQDYGDKEIYKVVFEQDLPHIQTGVGMYQIDLSEFTRERNLLIIHSSDEVTGRGFYCN